MSDWLLQQDLLRQWVGLLPLWSVFEDGVEGLKGDCTWTLDQHPNALRVVGVGAVAVGRRDRAARLKLSSHQSPERTETLATVVEGR